MQILPNGYSRTLDVIKNNHQITYQKSYLSITMQVLHPYPITPHLFFCLLKILSNRFMSQIVISTVVRNWSDNLTFIPHCSIFIYLQKS